MASQPKTPQDIRCTYQRKRVPLAWGARLDDARQICAHWHCRFGACLVLDDDRFRSICTRLVDGGFTAAEICLAIDAYHQVVTTDPYYRANGRANPRKPAGTDAHKTLAKFLEDERFEEWLDRANARVLEEHSSRARPASEMDAATRCRLLARLEELPRDDRRRLINQATEQLGPGAEARVLQTRILELLQQETQPCTS